GAPLDRLLGRARQPQDHMALAHLLDSRHVRFAPDRERHVLSLLDPAHGRTREAIARGSAGSRPSGIPVPRPVNEKGFAWRMASSTAPPMWLVASRWVST